MEDEGEWYVNKSNKFGVKCKVNFDRDSLKFVNASLSCVLHHHISALGLMLIAL